QDRSDHFPSKKSTNSAALQTDSYQTELGIVAQVSSVRSATETVKIRLDKGNLWATYLTREKTAYQIINTSKNEIRDLVARHMDEGDWRTVNTENPDLPPKTQFALRLLPGASGEVSVVSERRNEVKLPTALLPTEEIATMAANERVSGKVRDALKKILDL